ncbi:MAG: glycoside hydrolase family 95 protein [Acidobacteria bacterium]|nr:glycoside hydrolase family 95 protein [Acidobacteriota bacterium]
MRRRSFLRTATLAPALARAAGADSRLRLWYREPAADWNEALPIGNGRLGAMIFGGIGRDHLQLNDNTLYSDEPGRRDLPLDVSRDFERVIGMLRDRQYQEAGQYITKYWGGRAQPCYQPLGDLHLDFEGHSAPAEYTRELDLASAISAVSYNHKGVTFTREYFASFPDQVIVLRLSASKPGALNFRAALSSVHPMARTRLEGRDTLVLTGQAPGFALRRTFEWVEQRGEQWKYPEIWDKNGKRRPKARTVQYGDEIGGLGMFFDARLRAIAASGMITADASGLQIRGAREALLVLSAATSYNGFKKSPSREGAGAAARSLAHLASASARSFTALRDAHLADYRRLFERVSLSLGETTGQSRLPTDERIASYSNDRDPDLAALYFQFGRYLMIAGSRPGGQPLNLQGIWNPHVIPPWASAYTTNINTQMNYWLAGIGNLPECHEPLLRMVRELSVTGGGVARNMYKRRGWVEHHNTTIWRDAQPVDNDARPAFWPMGGAWLATHLWQHYLFTLDRGFLDRHGYPLMKGAAEFCADWLVDDGRGRLVTAASNSPEIDFRYVDESGGTRTAGVSMGPTMDLAIIRDLFAACIRASELLDRDPEFRAELKDKLARLLPYRIGSRGNLQEWPEDVIETDVHHRHISHLFALHPSNQITRRGTPELFEAARRTLELRGDEGTGWSRAWKINFWARMEDGNHAYKLVRNLLQPAKTAELRYTRGGVMPNLFCSHPPFQIDGNFGGAAGIAEMLLQSHAGEINLLPALPDAWPSGELRGLCARGGFELSLAWERGRLSALEILSKAGQPCVLRYHDRVVRLSTQAGKSYRFAASLERIA